MQGRRALDERPLRPPPRQLRPHAEPTPEAKPKPEPETKPETPPSPENTAFKDKPARGPLHLGLAIGMIGGGVVFAGAGIAALVIYKPANPEATGGSKLCDSTTKMCTPEGLAARDNAKTWAWVSTIGLGLGVVSGILFWALPVPESAKSVGFTPLPGGGAFSASGRF